MEFHGLHRRTLQSLCKKNNIPANLTNAAMAEALSALPTVIGADEAQEEALRTPTSKPTSLRPPNPPRSCRRSSVLPLLKEESFPKNSKDLTTSLLSVGIKRRRTAGVLLFPCSEQHVSDEMPVRKENCEDTKDAVFALEEMCEINGDARMKRDVKEEVSGDCLDAEAAVMPSPADSINVDFYAREENEDMDAEMMRGEKEAEENGCGQRGNVTRASSERLDAAVEKPSSVQLVSEQHLTNVEYLSEYEDAEMTKDKKGGNCRDEAAVILEDYRYEAVTTPSSLQLVAEQGFKNVEFVSEYEDAEMTIDKKGGNCHDEAAAILEDYRYEAVTTPSSLQLVGEQGFKNVEFVSEYKDAEMTKEKKGEDCLDEAVAVVEDQGLKNDVVFASEEMVIRGEPCDDENGGEEENVESYGKSELTCRDEAVRVPCSQESISMLKDQEEILQGEALSDMQSDEQEEHLKDDGMCHAVREAGERGLKYADVLSEELCASEERSEDKYAAMVKYIKQEEVDLVSFSGKSNLISASGGCLDEAVRLMSSQESVNTAKGQATTLLQSSSLCPLVPVEQDQHLKDDGVHQVLRGEMEEQSLNSAESESKEMLVSEERCEDRDSEIMNDVGSDEQGQSLDNDGGHQVLGGEVEDQSLNKVDFESEEMLASTESCEHMDPERMNGVKSGEKDQGSKDAEVHQVSEEEMEEQSMNDPILESAEISEDMDAEMTKDSKGEERADNGAIQMGASVFENYVGEVCLPVNGDQIAPLGSETKNPTSANAVCGNKVIPMLKDQECELPQEVLGGNLLAETCEMPIRGRANEETEAENRSVGIQVELGDEIGIQKTLPEVEDTVNSPIMESNSGIKIPVLEKGEDEKREFVEGTNSGKRDKEVAEVEMAMKKQSIKKEDLSTLSLRKLKVLYKEKKQVGKLEMENKEEGRTGSGGIATKDELEERSAEKMKLNGLSLRQLKQMYKHEVAKTNLAEA